jgi:hypothetical protein
LVELETCDIKKELGDTQNSSIEANREIPSNQKQADCDFSREKTYNNDSNKQLDDSLFSFNNKELRDEDHLLDLDSLNTFQHQQQNFLLKQHQQKMYQLELQAQLQTLNQLPQIQALSNEQKLKLLHEEKYKILEHLQLQHQIKKNQLQQQQQNNLTGINTNASNFTNNQSQFQDSHQREMLLQSIQLQQLQQKFKQQKNLRYNASADRMNQQQQHQNHQNQQQQQQQKLNLLQQQFENLNFCNKVRKLLNHLNNQIKFKKPLR